jgi:hypothetical protein
MAIGANHKGIGLIMTLVSVELVQLEKTGVGTGDVKANYLSSGLQPLFNRQTTEHFLHR